VKKVTLSVAKKTLSRLIGCVRRGETVLILDRDTPVARLEPVGRDPGIGDQLLPALVRKGVIAPPRKHLDAEAFLARRIPALPGGASAIGAVLEERQAGR
jgi:antitoxin (DNA-binding transcriptional repressor) of toxin-antitoxin stability system